MNRADISSGVAAAVAIVERLATLRYQAELLVLLCFFWQPQQYVRRRRARPSLWLSTRGKSAEGCYDDQKIEPGGKLYPPGGPGEGDGCPL